MRLTPRTLPSCRSCSVIPNTVARCRTRGLACFQNGWKAAQHRPSRLGGLRHNSSLSAPRPDSLEPHNGPTPTLSHTIDQLSPSLTEQKVVLGGWLYSQRRASGDLHFFTLRDSSGSVQLICRKRDISERLMSMPLESVILVEGKVLEKRRKAETSASGSRSPGPADVEIEVDSLTLLNPAEEALPLYASRQAHASDDLRAEYRYLDLRRPELAANLKTRSKVAHLIRCHLHDLDFDEIDTPILLNSSPEGAREFLVPTRTSPGSPPSFYALQQSPQQPKQLLIASGATSKYFQMARCFRDEDGRRDRQPEFTQVDLEMAFVSGSSTTAEKGQGDRWGIGGREVKEVVEGLMRRIWKEIKGEDLDEFKIMPYQMAMDVYGSDKPDTRFDVYTLPIGYYPGLSDADLDKIVLDQSQYTVEWMITPASQVARLDIEKFKSPFVQPILITERNVLSWQNESPLLAPMKLELNGDGTVAGGGVEVGDIIWLAQRKKLPEGGWTLLGRLRVQIMEELVARGLMTLPHEPHFLWVTQFPLFTRADEDKEFLSKGRWASSHHPFTAPMYEDSEDLKKGEVERVRGQHYDLVLNGQEIGGGSVRIHDAKLQEHVLRDILKLDDSEVNRFGHLLKALKFGAPPHGGIALGFDRLVAILCGTKSIREVLAFPKTQSGADPVFKSPSTVDLVVLRGYGLEPINRSSK